MFDNIPHITSNPYLNMQIMEDDAREQKIREACFRIESYRDLGLDPKSHLMSIFDEVGLDANDLNNDEAEIIYAALN